MKWYYILTIILLATLIITLVITKNNKKENYPDKQEIPKYIFQTIRSKNDINDKIMRNIKYLRDNNPTYKYFLYDDNDCINFIKNNYDKKILDVYMSINAKYGPAKADLFRYLLMYKYGGIYLDIKSSCDVPFSKIIDNDTKYILSHWSVRGHSSRKKLNNFYGEFQQWHIICIPQHPFLKKVIDDVVNNIKNYNIYKDGTGKDMVLEITGPIAYTKAITPLLNKYGHVLYKSHKHIKLLYASFDHIEYYGDTHYSLCTEPLIKNEK
jgi:mannosyltransferase OCH1-like enzyme